ncbi:MAG: hypothetical protein IKI65_03345 [Firmicutes bacterium]|nr:hypothetical protein [Bacillota bacterium]
MHKAEIMPPVVLEAPEEVSASDLRRNAFLAAEEDIELAFCKGSFVL